MNATAYIRWSSDEQTDGHSLERQSANIKAYCERVGLTITATLKDEGFSASKGRHISKGALGRYLTEVDKGQHRGTALAVEQMDRLSRLGIHETQLLLARILSGGVHVHVTQENRAIRDLNDFASAILNLVQSHGASKFSKELGERMGSVWRSKKHDGLDGISITRKLPGWLQGEVGEPIRVNVDKAKVIRRIFEMAAGGMGARTIARILNEDGVPAFGGGRPKKRTDPWIPSYILKILNNRAVLGEFQPRKGGKPDGDVRIGFFPAVIDHKLWQEARGALVARTAANSRGKGGRTGKVSSIFTGLAWDVTNGDPLPMHYQDKGKRSKPKLATATSVAAYRHTIQYGMFEAEFLKFLDEINWVSVLDISESAEILDCERKLSRLTGEVESARQQVEKIANVMIGTGSRTLGERLAAAEAQVDTLNAARTAMERQLAHLRTRNQDLLDDSVAYQQLSTASDVQTRSRLRGEVIKKVSRIEFRFASNNRCVAVITFVNGSTRLLEFLAGRVVTYFRGDRENPLP